MDRIEQIRKRLADEEENQRYGLRHTSEVDRLHTDLRYLLERLDEATRGGCGKKGHTT